MRYLLVLTVFSFFFYQVRALGLKLNCFNSEKCFDLKVNQSQTIKCDVVNNSNTETLIWYRGTQQVDIKPENSLNSSTVCLPAVAPDDNGVSFTCLLKSDTTIKQTVQLNVLFEPILSGDTKTITQAGQNIQLTCGFKANPAVAMSWRRNGSIVAFPSRFEQRMSSNTWTLSITKVAMSDTDNYTCVAVTPSGNVTTLTFELIVGERQPGLPVEAIGGAVVVGCLIICFGLFARRQKIFKQCMKSRHNTAM
ncbi:transmembrane and immunoglobulin domain-containing protein 1 [Rana temporaria]|uniref:transmembrane and immunoglobulin domain-containing protein 1 n=1 Tax=Rana temporaria TaxID=8407 RepID=UPI001AAC66BB|nr:transmembrane and immunoglobulin domain-containing protein 1 [Rana temporaria]